MTVLPRHAAIGYPARQAVCSVLAGGNGRAAGPVSIGLGLISRGKQVQLLLLPPPPGVGEHMTPNPPTDPEVRKLYDANMAAIGEAYREGRQIHPSAFLADPPKVERLEFRPGDMFLLTSRRPLTAEQVARLAAQWKQQFASAKVIVLENMGVQVIRRHMRSDPNPFPRLRLFRWLP